GRHPEPNHGRRHLGGRGPPLPLPPDRRHRTLQGPGRNRPRHRGERRGDRHRRGAAREPRRSQGADAPGLRGPAPLRLPAQHRRLLHRAGRRPHAAPRPRGRRLELGEAGGARPAALPLPRHARHLRGRRSAVEGRLRGDGLLLRRPHRRQAAGGDGLRRRNAPRRPHRLGPRHPKPGDDPRHRGAGQSPGAGGRRRRHGERRRGGDGTRLPRGADEQRHRPRQGPRDDGPRHEGGGGGGAPRLPCRPDAAPVRRGPFEPHGRPDPL
ncbi:MAG: Thiazole synthase, partial [uncultured Acetobacteraceae bacterium]